MNTDGLSDKASLPINLLPRLAAFGEDGRRWFENLPATLALCAQRWGLSIGQPVDELSYNYVAPALLADGRELMLKLGVPRPELSHEIAALQQYDGRGAVRLIDMDAGAGILLLERLRPGQMLVSLGPERDKEATRIAARVMKRLWRPVDATGPFDNVARWSKGFGRLRATFGGGTGPFPPGMVAEAEAIYQRFLAEPGQRLLLHGDLHHYNILSAEREPWLAIDPKGVVGEAAYEAGALLRNPLTLAQWPDLAAIQSRRLDILSQELGISRRRLRQWAYAQAVLSAWWTFEDEGIVGDEWLLIAHSLQAAN